MKKQVNPVVIIFDLDDTLYNEATFVHSGFRAVADYLSPLIELSRDQIFDGLNAEFLVQREKIFDRFLLKYHRKNQKLVNACISVYRGHEPVLNLFPEAKACLARFQKYPLYIVTDGNQIVQRNKVQALGLDLLVRRCFYTYAHGRHRSKPSPYCFEKICAMENINASSAVYVADNPHKDFVGIKPLGFQTIRVLTSPYANVEVESAYDADIIIPNLQSFDDTLLQKLKLKD